MIPPLNEIGYLPAGVHHATMDELLTRFGNGSTQRIAQAQSLKWLEELCRQAAISRMLVNGSFVTNRREPNDVDCVLLAPADYSEHSIPVRKILDGLPFLEIKIVNSEEYSFFSDILFASDRKMVPKGVVEIYHESGR